MVRSTRPCQYTPTCFIGKKEYRNLRDPNHVAKFEAYPDPQYYLSSTQKYFFRHEALRHLRIEQFNRYLSMAGETGESAPMTLEDTISDGDEAPVDTSHRNFDQIMEDTSAGTHFNAAFKLVPGCKRRQQSRLGVSRVPFIEPIGDSREDFYENKLCLGLSWFCGDLPEVVKDAEGRNHTVYTFQWNPPKDDDMGGVQLDCELLKLGKDPVSFEVICNRLECKFAQHELGLVCWCCAAEITNGPCPACRHSTGFHKCQNERNHQRHQFLWRKGTLFAGSLDCQRVLFNLHRWRFFLALFPNKGGEGAGSMRK